MLQIDGKWITENSIKKMSLLDLAKLQKRTGTKGITEIKESLAEKLIASLKRTNSI